MPSTLFATARSLAATASLRPATSPSSVRTASGMRDARRWPTPSSRSAARRWRSCSTRACDSQRVMACSLERRRPVGATLGRLRQAQLAGQPAARLDVLEERVDVAALRPELLGALQLALRRLELLLAQVLLAARERAPVLDLLQLLRRARV